MVSVFSRRADVEGPDGYVWFVADSAHPAYALIGNVVHGQMYVSNFALEDYPVREEDILCTGPEAFSVALNTVNVGKFNLCTASIGMCEHAFYEAITHANNRILYGNPVTDFPHVKASFVDVYARIVAMKLFSDRAIDYFRSASLEDRRYLLFNPVTKAKVTSEGETVVRLLWDVLAAKGFERNTYFAEVDQADRCTAPAGGHRARQRRADPEVHAELPVQSRRPTRRSAPATTRPTTCSSGRRDRRGAPRRCSSPTGWRSTRRPRPYPNVGRFAEQARALQQLLATAAPDAEQQRDLDFMLVVGHLFTLVVYGQLILEQAEILGLERGSGRPDLRRPGARLLRIRGRPARKVEFDCSPTGMGAGRGAQAGARRGPLRAGLAAGEELRRRLPDASLARQRTLTSALKVHASLVPPGQGWP